MKYMKSAEIRDAFLQYFASKKHEVVASSSLVPSNDPTLLFTNAGMVQFKDVFLGEDKRPYTRATSSQRCVRAGGKHNDLENVGYTARHHTFFEMLGNFSFGDYFKREAIKFAWEFLTQTLGLPPERLWVTVHISDDEAADIWIKEVGVDPDRFSRLDEDNFWQMGETGPCGPSSEIFFDHGEGVPGGPPGSENDDLDRYIEIWNLVFMQFERQVDGELKPLPKPSVDTGMGLERVAAIMQEVHSNYEIDLFQALLGAAAKITESSDLESKSLRVLADHIRSCAFLIMDGVLPSNEKQGYVLRRIIRRAVRHGHKLGVKKAFFHKLLAALVEQMGQAYPELAEKQAFIEKVLLAEEEQFGKTLDKGMKILNEELENLRGTVISGDIAFTLHDRYGFPLDLTSDIARERELTVDVKRFDALMKEQAKQGGGINTIDYVRLPGLEGQTDFMGYENLSGNGKIIALLKGDKRVDSLKGDDKGAVVLSSTPFYGESGGQVGDAGYITFGNAKFEVHDCKKNKASHIHIGHLIEGELKVGDEVSATVDASVRRATALNHSATHLLHAALREVLGTHVTQKGSLVDSERLRFDFSHFEALTSEELQRIEKLVNDQILLNSPVETELCDMDTAQKKGAMALFGEKYGNEVRVLTMGEGFSVELCGGTHVQRTGDIGLMRIVSETGIAAGVRRIEAVTGQKALRLFDETRALLSEAAQQLKTTPEKVVDKLVQLVTQNRQLEKELVVLKGKLASSSVNDWLTEAEEIHGVKVLAKILQGIDAKSLRDMVDQLKNKLGTSAVLLASVNEGKIFLAAGVSSDAIAKIKAGAIVKHIAEQVGGKGGGRPDMAQGGGTDVDALPAAIKGLSAWASKTILA